MDLSPHEYRALADFRYQIRRYLHFSEEQARTHELEPQQHQLLLAIKGLPEGKRATIGELASRLQLKHHSMVELVDRLEKHGYVNRTSSADDRRQVIVHLTRSGAGVLRSLSLAHRRELDSAGPALATALRCLRRARGNGSKTRRSAA
ncbi:MAG TPA: MarR family transcriptional regulator [Bryobacteraceae bacterium]|nr:MarR family transcriptional regulator [Bryobacteraceae bacterium]